MVTSKKVENNCQILTFCHFFKKKKNSIYVRILFPENIRFILWQKKSKNKHENTMRKHENAVCVAVDGILFVKISSVLCCP